jgi:ABC-2 type transport system ATP-binding protein
VLQGTVANLAKQVLGGGYTILIESGRTGADGALAGLPGVLSVVADGVNRYRIAADSDVRAAVAERLVSRGIPILRLNVIEPSLDEIYARYFQNQRAAA